MRSISSALSLTTLLTPCLNNRCSFCFRALCFDGAHITAGKPSEITPARGGDAQLGDLLNFFVTKAKKNNPTDRSPMSKRE